MAHPAAAAASTAGRQARSARRRAPGRGILWQFLITGILPCEVVSGGSGALRLAVRRSPVSRPEPHGGDLLLESRHPLSLVGRHGLERLLVLHDLARSAISGCSLLDGPEDGGRPRGLDVDRSRPRCPGPRAPGSRCAAGVPRGRRPAALSLLAGRKSMGSTGVQAQHEPGLDLLGAPHLDDGLGLEGRPGEPWPTRRCRRFSLTSNPVAARSRRRRSGSRPLEAGWAQPNRGPGEVKIAPPGAPPLAGFGLPATTRPMRVEVTGAVSYRCMAHFSARRALRALASSARWALPTFG